MDVSGTIGEILRHKGATVWSVTPDGLVFDAIQLMADKNIGAVLVMEGETLEGILSERDYTRKVILKGKSSKDTTVREIMSTHLLTTTPHSSVADCLRIMTDRRVRHLPVVEDGKVVGIISIGNLVNWVISAQTSTINQLESYIAGGYSA